MQETFQEKMEKRNTERQLAFLETQFVKFGTFVVVESSDGNARLTIIDQGFVGIFVPFFFLEWVPFRSARSVADGRTSTVVLIGITASSGAGIFTRVGATAGSRRRRSGSDRTALGVLYRATFASFIQTNLGRSRFLQSSRTIGRVF